MTVMLNGAIVEQAPTPVLFKDPQHPYTQTLLDSIPIPDPARSRFHNHEGA